MAQRPKRLKQGDPGNRHPYTKFENSPLWPLINKAIAALVDNKDLVEKEHRDYITGYICKVILKGLEAGKPGRSRESA